MGDLLGVEVGFTLGLLDGLKLGCSIFLEGIEVGFTLGLLDGS